MSGAGKKIIMWTWKSHKKVFFGEEEKSFSFFRLLCVLINLNDYAEKIINGIYLPADVAFSVISRNYRQMHTRSEISYFLKKGNLQLEMSIY